MAFRPDGRSVVAACDDGTVKVWDRETGRETFSFHGELLAYPWSAWFSPDARRLAWSCLDGFIKVWDTTTGQLEINQQSNTHQCRAVAFSPDGKRIAVAGFDGTIRLLDGATGREMLTIFAHNSLVAGRDIQSRWPPTRVLQLRSHGPHLGRYASDQRPTGAALCHAHWTQGQGLRRCLQSRRPLARLGQLGPHHQALGTFRQRRIAGVARQRSSRQRQDSVRLLFAIHFAGIAGL